MIKPNEQYFKPKINWELPYNTNSKWADAEQPDYMYASNKTLQEIIMSKDWEPAELSKEELINATYENLNDDVQDTFHKLIDNANKKRNNKEAVSTGANNVKGGAAISGEMVENQEELF